MISIGRRDKACRSCEKRVVYGRGATRGDVGVVRPEDLVSHGGGGDDDHGNVEDAEMEERSVLG